MTYSYEINPPLISIVIATYNVGILLENTLISVFNQTYKNIEILVIDGGSEDQTVTYIEKHRSQITYYISEVDDGIYDAWNKGLKQAKGEWIAFLGAGDEYLPEALQMYVDLIANLPYSVEFVSSRVAIVDGEGKCFYIHGKPWSWPKFLTSMTCAHVGALHSRALFEKYGIFDITYRIAGDYEFLMRASSQLKAAFLPMVTVHMLNGGISTSSKILFEDRRLKISTGRKISLIANIEFVFNYSKRLARIVYKGLLHRIPLTVGF